MDYLNSSLSKTSEQNKLKLQNNRISLSKNNYTINKKFIPSSENIYKNYTNYYINKNYQNELNSLNDNYHNLNSQRNFDEYNDDDELYLLSNYRNISLEENTMSPRINSLYPNSQLDILNENKNKKVSNSIKELLSMPKSHFQKKESINSNTYSLCRTSVNQKDIKKKYNNHINMKRIFNTLTERHFSVKKFLKENNDIKSKIDDYLIEGYKLKLEDDKFYYDKYNELEKEFNILKISIMDYQKQNKELIKEIINLKNKNEDMQIKNKNELYDTNNIEIISKENNKLLNENKIYKKQIEEYIKKIKELIIIIQNKDNYIKILKNKLFEKENIIKNKINSNDKNIKQGKTINKSVDKLIIENEENKKKINQIFEKIKDLGNFEKEYKQFLNKNIKETKELERKENGSPNISVIKANHKKDYKIQKNEILFINNFDDFNNKTEIKKVKYTKNKIEIQKVENIKLNEKSLNLDRNKDKLKNNFIKKIKYKSIEEKKDNLNGNSNNKEKENLKSNNTKNRRNRFSEIKVKQVTSEEYIKDEIPRNKCSSLKESFEQKDKKIKEEVIEKERKRNHTYRDSSKKKIKILDGIDISEIYTSRPVRVQETFSFLSSKNLNNKYLFLFGADKNNNFFQFDLINKKWLKKKNILDIEDLSDSFKNNYIYENSIFYNTLNGFFILTGKSSNILYYYNSINETLIKICQFNNDHFQGSLLFDSDHDRIFVFSGNDNKSCEYFSFNEKKVYNIPELNNDRTNASFIIFKNKIYCFFGYSNLTNKFIHSIEYIDIQKLDEWKLITKNTSDFENLFIEKVAIMTFKETYPNYIYLYGGIKKNEKNEIIEEKLIKFDTSTNKIYKINDINFIFYKFLGTKWRKTDFSDKNYGMFEFEKNSNFIELPKIESNDIDNSNKFVTKIESKNTKVLIDSNYNIHYLFLDSNNIEIFKCYYK